LTYKIINKRSVSELLYSAILYLLIPFVLLRLLLISLRKPAYRERIAERFGYAKLPVGEQAVIWIHAVSVGEVLASKPLVDQLLNTRPQYRILITTMTPSGAETVRSQFGHRVKHCYVPYDLPGAVRRFILNVKPVLLAVMETEIWPNLFYYCKRNNIPVVIANARMSERSCAGYMRLATLTENTLSGVACVIAQGQADAQRFVALGLDEKKIRISGSIKFDMEFPEAISKQGRILHKEFFLNRPVWIAASTHAGEEKLVLSAFDRILQQYPDCLLIIAPRHPERADAIAALSTKSGFITARKSTGQQVHDQTRVYLLDTLGELPVYYAASDLAFVGGSLVPHGGHNMLEPACLGVPVITGPYNHNFSDISTMLQNAGAAWIVANEEELSNRVNKLLGDMELRHSAGAKGRKLVEENRGNIHRVMDILRSYLPENATSGIN
jgi:3-deoxy-D-manno-octulosonic-acid transferase